MRTSYDLQITTFQQSGVQFKIVGTLVPTPVSEMITLCKADIRKMTKCDIMHAYDNPIHLNDVYKLVKEALHSLYFSGRFDSKCKSKSDIRIRGVNVSVINGSGN